MICNCQSVKTLTEFVSAAKIPEPDECRPRCGEARWDCDGETLFVGPDGVWLFGNVMASACLAHRSVVAGFLNGVVLGRECVASEVTP